jgi:putative endonuclease
MPSPRQRYGTESETQAEAYLRAKGFVILDRHVTSRFGEIDILAQDKKTIVAVEVKARRNQKFGRAIESLTEKKLQNIAAALHGYLQNHQLSDKPIRIDVLTIEPDGIGHVIGVGPEN